MYTYWKVGCCLKTACYMALLKSCMYKYIVYTGIHVHYTASLLDTRNYYIACHSIIPHWPPIQPSSPAQRTQCQCLLGLPLQGGPLLSLQSCRGRIHALWSHVLVSRDTHEQATDKKSIVHVHADFKTNWKTRPLPLEHIHNNGKERLGCGEICPFC